MNHTVAWRIASAKYSKVEAFSGEGGMISGGRWNTLGTRMTYTSDSLALATLEIYLRLGRSLRHKNFKAYKIEIPDAMIRFAVKMTGTISKDDSRKIGDDWIEKGESCLMVVPSAIIPAESNCLLNPEHPDFEKIIIHDAEDAYFDPRL